MSAFALQFLENLWKGFDVDFFFQSLEETNC